MTASRHPVPVDRAAGALLMMAMGESLGFLVSGEEMGYAEDIARHSLSEMDPPWIEKHEYCFGQYAIDTQLARELALSIVESRGFSPVVFSARVGDLFRMERAFVPGEATARAGGRLADGMACAQAGEPAPAAGNGAIVRAVPLGLCFKSRRLRQGASRMQALVTHHDERAQAGSEVVAELIFQVASSKDGPDRALVEHLATVAEELDRRLASSLRTLDRVMELPLERVVAELAAAGYEETDGYPSEATIAGFSTPTILYALYAFMREPDSPEEALALALSGGGDTSSLGALVGALSGARIGWKELGPRMQSWAKLINDQGEHGPNDLIALAKGLVLRK
jgi:ADP-ribosylglycohydrolase